MRNPFIDIETGEMGFALSDNMLMDSDGDLLMKMSDNMAVASDFSSVFCAACPLGFMVGTYIIHQNILIHPYNT